MSNDSITSFMEQGILENIFPGAVLAFGKKEKKSYCRSFGFAQKIPTQEIIFPETMFDIASITKPLSTGMIAMRLFEKGILDLQMPLHKIFPAFNEKEKSEVKVFHLLQHTSGLPAWKPYFEEFKATAQNSNFHLLRQKILEQILKEPLIAKAGEKRIYSDLGYILLGEIFEQLTQKPLSELFMEEVARPLQLKNTFFVPENNLSIFSNRSISSIASTEVCPWRKKTLRGEVHDDHAWMMGGVAGHAGLFSRIDDLVQWTEEIFKVLEGNSSFLKKESFETFLKEPSFLIWDTPTPPHSQAGSLFSSNTIGHLGYTGCSIWIDLNEKNYIILLTNRVHPTRQNEAIKKFRPKLHDLILSSLK